MPEAQRLPMLYDKLQQRSSLPHGRPARGVVQTLLGVLTCLQRSHGTCQINALMCVVGDGTMQLLSSVCPFINVRKGEGLQRKGHAWFLLGEGQSLCLAPLYKDCLLQQKNKQKKGCFFNKGCSVLFMWLWKKMFYQSSYPREQFLPRCWPLVKRSCKPAALFIPPAEDTTFPVMLWGKKKKQKK